MVPSNPSEFAVAFAVDFAIGFAVGFAMDFAIGFAMGRNPAAGVQGPLRISSKFLKISGFFRACRVAIPKGKKNAKKRIMALLPKDFLEGRQTLAVFLPQRGSIGTVFNIFRDPHDLHSFALSGFRFF